MEKKAPIALGKDPWTWQSSLATSLKELVFCLTRKLRSELTAVDVG
jgi:hypothetical protein